MKVQRHNPVFVWLALFALSLQLVLSLGHSHASLSQNGDAAHWADQSYGRGEPGQLPISPDQPDDCQICIALSSLRTAVLADVQWYVAPAFWTTIKFVQPELLFEQVETVHHYRARAPPRY